MPRGQARAESTCTNQVNPQANHRQRALFSLNSGVPREFDPCSAEEKYRPVALSAEQKAASTFCPEAPSCTFGKVMVYGCALAGRLLT
jgi:hypothetical protein